MSKEEFLEFPNKEHPTTIFSIGPPGSGKTFIFLRSLEFWIKSGYFKEFHLILPAYKNEFNESYKFLADIPNVYIYESYHSQIGKKLVAICDKDALDFRAKKIKNRTKYFFGVDDATGQGKKIMSCEYAVRMATEPRHLMIHNWFLLHHTAAIIPPSVREQTKFSFIYDVNVSVLKTIWKEYVNFKEFRKWNDFMEFWDEYIAGKKYGCLLIWRNTKYNPWVSEEFS